MRLADTTLTRDNGRRRGAVRDHRGQGLEEGEPIGHREIEARINLSLGNLTEALEVHAEQALRTVHRLGLGDNLAIAHGDILAAGAVKADGVVRGSHRFPFLFRNQSHRICLIGCFVKG